MKAKLRSLKIGVLTISVLAGTVQMASADNSGFPSVPKPSTSGTGPCCSLPSHS